MEARSVLPLAAALLVAAPSAYAQSAAPCLSIQRRATVAGALDGVATLVDDVVVEPGCEVALRQDSSRWTRVEPGPRSFVALVADVQGIARSEPRAFDLNELPHAVYARRVESAAPRTSARRARGRAAALTDRAGQSFVLLSRCVDTLGQRPSIDARVLPAAHACEGPLEVRASAESAARCPAHIEAEGRAIAPSAQLAACRDARPASYELTAGSGHDPLRIRIGTISARDAATPLQQHFRSLNSDSSTAVPIVLARAPEGLWGLGFDPRTPAGLRAELRAAAAAEELIFARAERSLGAVILTGESEDESVARVPEAVFREAMARAYGDAGLSLAPTIREARAAMRDLRVCLPGRYSVRPSAMARVRESDACAPLARVMSEDTSALDRDIPVRRLWAERTLWRMSAHGADPLERARTESVALRASESPAALSWVLATGDRVGVEGDPRGLFLCGERGCEPLDDRGQQALAHAGLYELRAAPDRALASTAQATTLARWVVIDPLHDWLPTGLVTSRETLPGPLWLQLAHDDSETYAWERRTHSLASSIAWTERAVSVRARARSEGSAQTVLTRDVAVLTSDPRRAGAPSSSALTVVLSRDPRCPDLRASDARAQAVSEPDALPPSAVFYAFLAEDQGPDRPLACIARARFRVRPRRTVAAAGPVTVGVLGDPRLAWFSPWENWGAVGAVIPAIYTRASAGPWLSTELSLSAVAGFAPGRGAIDVVGPALVLDVRAAVLTLGVAMFAPRLSSDRAPQFNVSPFVAIDVGTIYELAGGR